MIKYQKAINIISRVSLNLSNEKISTLDSLNRVCAKNILSPTKNPLANNTAFDGFALSAKETRGISKKKVKKFKILKSIGAGDNPKINNYQKNAAINKKFSCQTRLLGLEANLIMAMNSNFKRKEAKSIIDSIKKYC